MLAIPQPSGKASRPVIAKSPTMTTSEEQEEQEEQAKVDDHDHRDHGEQMCARTNFADFGNLLKYGGPQSAHQDVAMSWVSHPCNWQSNNANVFVNGRCLLCGPGRFAGKKGFATGIGGRPSFHYTSKPHAKCASSLLETRSQLCSLGSNVGVGVGFSTLSCQRF
mmetsp:Transcript_11139/g.35505  ORF Transcript_11139/g.35505 Transcript_11139/m.35505 type:complete len:165 (+) Transcript_11139:721-1215(+)